ncbi:hypothetical protein DXA27_22775 [Bacteroides fragilis]|uniref:Uncharacterized protein n=1 Tax=Bacteroides fragilis TaxID=817 RepID=A0A413JRL0_BACFG|nr:hypothetical protein DXA27_22775 [Bacteroides fragilis]
MRTFSENAYSFRVKCLLLFTQMLPSFPEKPGSSAEKLGYPLPPTSICPSFSSGASDTKKASVSQKKRLVSFCSTILRMADTCDTCDQIFRNIFRLYIVHRIRNTIR